MKRMMWLIAIGYPLGLAILAFALMQRDPRLIFDQYYMLATLAIAPAFFLSLVVVIARSDGAPKLSWSATLGFWVLIVTALHLWFIGTMAQSL
ncbi:MAG: hypothetical protein AAFY31_09195 [Pseudomonadota bacterium]